MANDLYWQGRKAGGILIDNIVMSQETGVGSWKWAIVGIGININQTSFSNDLPNPVSLKQITGKNYDPLTLARELCQNLITFTKNSITGVFKKTTQIIST